MWKPGKVKYIQLDYQNVEPVYADDEFFLENTENMMDENGEKCVDLKQYSNTLELRDGTPEAKYLKDLIWVNYANLNYTSVKVSKNYIRLSMIQETNDSIAKNGPVTTFTNYRGRL